MFHLYPRSPGPVLTSCCGNHFCRSCVEEVRRNLRSCPLCGAQNFTTMLDKYFTRKVNELQVACTHKEMGCSWQGTINTLKEHLEPEKGDCKYMRIECPYFCGTFVNFSELKNHQKVCRKRPYTCKFCQYKGVYEDMSVKHWKVCDKYPIPCPNNCGETDIERQLMKKHLDDCSFQKRDCEFSYAGCAVCLDSSDMSKHLADCIQYHLSLVSKHCLNLSQLFPRNFHSQIKKDLQSKDSEIKQLQLKLKESTDEVSLLQTKLVTLEDEVDELKLDCFHLRSVTFIPPFKFIMSEFRKYKQNEQQWFSPGFYTHFGGYRLCISVDASGSGEGEGTHMSVYVNLMKGEYDGNLKWPFKGSILIELCNQRDTNNIGNIKEKIVFTYDASEIAGRVTGRVVAEQGLGIPTFIEHSNLGFNSKKNTEYLKNDCLHFTVLSVDLMNRRYTITK